MKYEFHPAALQEYAEAVEFFAQQTTVKSGSEAIVGNKMSRHIYYIHF